MSRSEQLPFFRKLLIVSLFFSAQECEAFNNPNVATTLQTDAIPSTRPLQIMPFNDAVQRGTTLVASLAFAATIFSASPVLADEYGVEKEAPTIFTGETVQICVKRGPLGACTKTEERTVENDNDKSLKYFMEPSDALKKRDLSARTAPEEGSALVERLRQQTIDNKEKNDLLVKQKTMLNDQSASFGPFDRQVVIMNEDGKGFTLLQNPQAMRLKKAGLIKDRQFVRQPTEEELETALEAEGPSIGAAFQGLFGGGD